MVCAQPYDEKDSPDHDSLHFHIKVHWNWRERQGGREGGRGRECKQFTTPLPVSGEATMDI